MPDYQDLLETADELRQIKRHFGDRIEADAINAAARCINPQIRALSRLNLDRCNGVRQADGFAGWSDANEQHARHRESIIMQAIAEAFATAFGSRRSSLVLEYQGDPRGPALVVNAINGPERIAVFY